MKAYEAQKICEPTMVVHYQVESPVKVPTRFLLLVVHHFPLVVLHAPEFAVHFLVLVVCFATALQTYQ